MSDMTMCLGKTDKGTDCPERFQCARWLLTPTPDKWTMYFVRSPYFNESCVMFIQKGA